MAKKDKADPLADLMPSANDQASEDAEAKHADAELDAIANENAALLARIKKLEAQAEAKAARIEELEAAPQAANLVTMDPNNENFVEGAAPDLNPTFKVSVPDATKDVLVHAPDAVNAFERYRQKTGMIRTERTPEIVRLSA